MIIFNLIGIGICAIAFGSAFAIGRYFGISGEDPLMLIAGPIAIVADLLYRLKSKGGHWIHPRGGGALFFLPVWCFGVIWIVIGATRMFL
jgi:hypothetical protein